MKNLCFLLLLAALATSTLNASTADTPLVESNGMMGFDSTLGNSDEDSWNHQYRWICYARNYWAQTFWWVNWTPQLAQYQAIGLCQNYSHAPCYALGCRLY